MKAIHDHIVVFASSLTDSNRVAETPAYRPPSFLLGPGGQDYIGQNSYDTTLAGDQGNL
jgi:hypothetical protein